MSQTIEDVQKEKVSYYELNKEKIRERYQNNAEKLKAYQTDYNQANHDKYISYQKSYYEERKEELLRSKREKIICECGKKVSIGHMSCHKKTKIHLKKMNIVVLVEKLESIAESS